MSLEKTKTPGYYRDTKTKMVINRNTYEYDQYIAGRQRVMEINRLNNTIKEMGGEIDEVKSLLQQILNKGP